MLVAINARLRLFKERHIETFGVYVQYVKNTSVTHLQEPVSRKNKF